MGRPARHGQVGHRPRKINSVITNAVDIASRGEIIEEQAGAAAEIEQCRAFSGVVQNFEHHAESHREVRAIRPIRAARSGPELLQNLLIVADDCSPCLGHCSFAGALMRHWRTRSHPCQIRSVTHVPGLDKRNLERAKGFEPSTPTLARSCSTPELHPHPERPGGWVAAGALRMPKRLTDCNNRGNRAEKRRAARQEPEPDRPHRPCGSKEADRHHPSLRQLPKCEFKSRSIVRNSTHGSIDKADMPATPDDLFAFLDRLGIAHNTVTHAPLFTVEQIAGPARRDSGRTHQEPLPQGQEGRGVSRRRAGGGKRRSQDAASQARRRPVLVRLGRPDAGTARRFARRRDRLRRHQRHDPARDRRARHRPDGERDHQLSSAGQHDDHLDRA